MQIDNNLNIDKYMYDPGTLSFYKKSEPTGKNKPEEENKLEKQRTNQKVQELVIVESKVKAHERAHKSVGGQYAGMVHFQYVQGPDGKMYIAGGEVSIDISAGKNPKETIQKMEQVKAAALAPADPSPQDYAVAAKAAMVMQKAQQQLAQQKSEEKQGPQQKTGSQVSVIA